MKRETLLSLFLSLSLFPAAALAHGDEVHEKPAGKVVAAVNEGKATAPIAGHIATLTATETGIHLTVKEKDGGAPSSATDAKLTVKIGKETRKLDLEGKDGDYHAVIDLKGAAKFIAVLSIKIDEKTSTCRFDVHGLAKE